MFRSSFDTKHLFLPRYTCISLTFLGAKNWGFRNALLALGHGVTVPNTGGICSAYFLRVPADIHDVHRYRLAVLRSPDNNILMLEAPSSDHTESEGDLDNYMAELQITTER